ncbi:ATP-binding protein [Streptomyces sp. NPDC014006]|uniref:ATP-binding protein n=1 Tax=Streptomyces sp. NPDC014006 TaxID=3364870 RepID=UPI003702E908
MRAITQVSTFEPLEAAMVYSPEQDYGSLAGDSPETAVRTRDVARGFLSVLAPDGGAEVEAVLLVVSELVTNAARHAGGVTGFGLKVGAGTVTVSVEDASPVPPWPRLPDPAEPGGFGWLLVQDLAMDVRVSGRASGKTVSAVLPLSR